MSAHHICFFTFVSPFVHLLKSYPMKYYALKSTTFSEKSHYIINYTNFVESALLKNISCQNMGVYWNRYQRHRLFHQNTIRWANSHWGMSYQLQIRLWLPIISEKLKKLIQVVIAIRILPWSLFHESFYIWFSICPNRKTFIKRYFWWVLYLCLFYKLCRYKHT